jgi:two-component system aerobic respiration control protein ArcA
MVSDKPKPKKSLILVVDDEIQMAMMLRANLEAEGYGVALATDALTGQKMALELYPDLILTDIYMPGLDGLSMMESLVKHPEMKKVPVIFVSGKATDTYVPKPDDPSTRYALLKKPLFLPELNQLIRQFLS